MHAARKSTRLPILSALAAAVALAVPSGASASTGCASASALPGAHASKRAMVHATLCLINGERRKRGLRPLGLSGRLSRAARGHSNDMARRHYFSHSSKSGASFVDRIRRTGYLRGARFWRVGENIAWGSGWRSSAQATVSAWMHSPGHRANILAAGFRHIGIGIAFGAPNGVRDAAATFTTDFGARG